MSSCQGRMSQIGSLVCFMPELERALLHCCNPPPPVSLTHTYTHTHTNLPPMTCSCLRAERQAGEHSNGTGALKSGTDGQKRGRMRCQAWGIWHGPEQLGWGGGSDRQTVRHSCHSMPPISTGTTDMPEAQSRERGEGCPKSSHPVL